MQANILDPRAQGALIKLAFVCALKLTRDFRERLKFAGLGPQFDSGFCL